MARRKSKNLSLSKEAVRKAHDLVKADCRPSLSNLVETLILKEHARLSLEPKSSDPEKAEVAG